MKENKNKKTIRIAIIAILIGIIIVSIIISNLNSKQELNLTPAELLKETENKATVSKLAELGERDRIEYYLSEFINNIESKNWEKAYKCLYQEFKNTYFPTENQFKEYCEENLPLMMEIDMFNIERVNNIYVIEASINDLINGNKNVGEKDFYFVIRENDFDDFDLSFSVNSAIDK